MRIELTELGTLDYLENLQLGDRFKAWELRSASGDVTKNAVFQADTGVVVLNDFDLIHSFNVHYYPDAVQTEFGYDTESGYVEQIEEIVPPVVTTLEKNSLFKGGLSSAWKELDGIIGYEDTAKLVGYLYHWFKSLV